MNHLKQDLASSSLAALLFATISFAAGGGLPADAQTIITAKDYSGFMRGSDDGWPDYVPPSNLGNIQAVQSNALLILDWSGAGILQKASSLTGPWTDVAGASPPHQIELATIFGAGLAQSFYRVRGATTVHSGVGAGCPQQGFDFTGLPPEHWANFPATPTQCGWIVPELATGFADVPSGGMTDAFVRVVLRSFSVSNKWTWWAGSPLTEEDDAIHQNEGALRFRVRHPNPMGMENQFRLRFELAFDNPYAFSGDPLQLNYWWVVHIFTPMFRVKDRSGKVGTWQHFADTNTHPTAGFTYDQRHYRCLFEQLTPATPWAEFEVAQNLPYALADRDAFLRFVRTNYPPQQPDLCIRKRHLGYGGLYRPTNAGFPSEFNELYAIELFKKVPGSESTPDLATNRIVLIMAGLDYEPAGNFVAEGSVREILDHWSTPGRDYRNLASYVIVPIGNPDAYEWPMCHVVPYGNGYADNAIHRAYMFLEPESAMPDAALDPEGLALRNYVRSLTAQGLDGHGGSIVALLDYQNDLCPHPNRWQQANSFFPPIWGFIFYGDTGQSNAAIRFLANLRVELQHPSTGRYVRDPATSQSWFKVQRANHGIPLWLLFEFDAAVLYSHMTGPPGGWQGQFPTPIQLPGTGGGPTFYAQGYIDQIGQATAGDPAHVFKLFGRDIIDAARRELLP